jgi:hypothetical protein
MIRYLLLLFCFGLSLSLFLYLITPSSYFNFLPYQIHETFFGASGFEKEFIIAFDFVVCVIVFLVLRKLLRLMFK